MTVSETGRVRMFRAIAFAAALTAYGVAVLGSWVRINGAGMTCPDWPLCRGALIPSLEGGVVLEWTHRLLVLVVSVLIVAVAVTGWRVRKQIVGVVPMVIFLIAAMALQIGLGGITIFQSNSPPSVTMHWGAAMLVLAAFTALAVLGVLAPAPGDRPIRSSNAFWPLLLPVIAAYATMLFGAFVSSSGWGLACPDVPLCNGTIFGQTIDQLVQMLHRIAASLLFLSAVYAHFATYRAPHNVRTAAALGLTLVSFQIVLGVSNVLWRLPTPLREAHAANAAIVFIVYIVALTLARITADPHTVPIAGSRFAGSRTA